jgi:endonuclease/exonuclease/phosphatase family metal-dependent hydrolase
VAPRLRIVSYNVHRRADDQAALASVVRELDPDVLVVQEGPRRFRWRQKSADLARRCGMIFAAGGQPALGNLIMTNLRVRPYQTRYLRYPLTPGRHIRGAALTTCAVPDGAGGEVPFTVAGTHLSLDAAERVTQATALKQEMAAATAPVLFAGDINEGPGAPAWQLLVDGLVDAAGEDARPTFSVANPRYRLDAVMVDPRVKVLSYQVVDGPAARRASDHFPVCVDVELSPVS